MKKRLLCGILLIALGAGVYSYPDWSAARTKHQQEQVIRQFQSEVSSDMQQEQETENEDTVWTETLLEQSKAYNETLFETKQAAFRDAEAVKMVPDFFPDAREPIGILSIPAMDCTLPLYVGATDAHLNLGAAVLGGTSLPVSGKNTNSVIAAHRGWKNGKYFKEIEKLQPGDVVFVENPWETLCYRVESCEVIAPTDSERLKIQEGRDMLTLITCHPYRSHGASRYVVYCVRTDSGQGSFTVTESGDEKREEQPIEDASTPDIQRELWCRRIGVCLILGCICMACVQTGKHLRKKTKEEESVKQRAKRLFFTGLMVCAMAASLVPVQAATIKEASVTWKEVSQDINENDQYVYDSDKTDATMPSLVLPKSSTGVLGYIDRGIVQKNTGSLLAPNWEGWWHMKGGWKQDTNGLTQLDDGGWYQFSNGRLQVSENETAKNSSSKGWLFLRDGKADLSYSGLVSNENGIFWADNGVVTTTKTEVVKDTIGITPDAGWIYVKNGVFDASATTVANNKNGWWMIRDGVVDFNYTGLAKNDAGWWYLQDGKVNFNYNGAVQNENGIWYVQGGNVKFDYNGHAYGYYFSGGCAQ